MIKADTQSSYNPAIILLVIYRREIKLMLIQKPVVNIGFLFIIAVLFIILFMNSQNLNGEILEIADVLQHVNLKITREWLNKLCHIPTMEYYSALKKTNY